MGVGAFTRRAPWRTTTAVTLRFAGGRTLLDAVGLATNRSVSERVPEARELKQESNYEKAADRERSA